MNTLTRLYNPLILQLSSRDIKTNINVFRIKYSLKCVVTEQLQNK